MSRPAFRWQHARTTDCPTCEATKGHPCIRLNPTAENLTDHGEHVSPHAARLRAEAALREERARVDRDAKRGVRS